MRKTISLISGCLSILLHRSLSLIHVQHNFRCITRRFSSTGTGKSSEDAADLIAIRLGIPSVERHIFLCCDQSKPKCCSLEDGIKSWDYLKMRMKDLNLVGNFAKAQRTKANCLQICNSGPIAVVYPDGINSKLSSF